MVVASLATTLDSGLIAVLTLYLEREEVTTLATALEVVSLPETLNLEREEAGTLATVTTLEVISQNLESKGMVEGSDSDAVACSTSTNCLKPTKPTTNVGR